MADTCDSNLHVCMTNTDKHPVTWWFTNTVYEHNHVLMSLSSLRDVNMSLLCLLRWCTGNRDSAAWRVESRARCRCPVAMDYSVRAAPPLQIAHCALNRAWNSSSLDLTIQWDHHRFQTSQSWFHRHQPRIVSTVQNYPEVILLFGNKSSTDLVAYF